MLDRAAHPNTTILLDAWRRMETDMETRWPAEASTDTVSRPDHHPGIIANLFVLRAWPDGRWTFRNAGDGLASRFGRSVLEEDFRDLWQGPDQTLVSGFLSAVAETGCPGLIQAYAQTLAGARLDVELALAPLFGSHPGQARLLGHYQTLGGEAMIGGRPVHRHVLTALWPPASPPTPPPHLRLVARND